MELLGYTDLSASYLEINYSINRQTVIPYTIKNLEMRSYCNLLYFRNLPPH